MCRGLETARTSIQVSEVRIKTPTGKEWTAKDARWTDEELVLAKRTAFSYQIGLFQNIALLTGSRDYLDTGGGAAADY